MSDKTGWIDKTGWVSNGWGEGFSQTTGDWITGTAVGEG